MGNKNNNTIYKLNSQISKLIVQTHLSHLTQSVTSALNSNNTKECENQLKKFFTRLQDISNLDNKQITDVLNRFRYVIDYYRKRDRLNDANIQAQYSSRANLLKNNSQSNYSLLDFAGNQIKIGTFSIGKTDLTFLLDLNTLNLTISALYRDNINPKLIHYVFPPASEIEYYDFNDNQLKDGDGTSDFLDFITTMRFDSIHTQSGQEHDNYFEVLELDKDSVELQLYIHYYTSHAKTPHAHFYQKSISEGLETVKHIEVIENPKGSGRYDITYDGKFITLNQLKHYLPSLPKNTTFWGCVKYIDKLKASRGNSYSFAINSENLGTYLEDLEKAFNDPNKNSPLLKYDLGMHFLASFGGPIYQDADKTDTSQIPSESKGQGGSSSQIGESSDKSSNNKIELIRANLNNKFEHAEQALHHVASIVSDEDAKKTIKNHIDNVKNIRSSDSSYRSKSILVLAQLYKCVNNMATYLTAEQLTIFMDFVTNYSYNNLAMSHNLDFGPNAKTNENDHDVTF